MPLKLQLHLPKKWNFRVLGWRVLIYRDKPPERCPYTQGIYRCVHMAGHDLIRVGHSLDEL